MVLNDDDVQRQIKQMVAFIEQEAIEKAEEIDAKAEEEFNIEKGRLVQNERLKIMEFFERKEKQVEIQKKIQSSKMLNQARLKTLKIRAQHIDDVLNEAKRRLSEIEKNPDLYKTILHKLILQAILQLLESNVILVVRKKDASIVKGIMDTVVKEYKNISHKDITLILDTTHFLAPEVCGGVEFLARKNMITISNTLESRLELISKKLLPAMRNAIYGNNPNRKYSD